jgi:hypothetical protein
MTASASETVRRDEMAVAEAPIPPNRRPSAAPGSKSPKCKRAYASTVMAADT